MLRLFHDFFAKIAVHTDTSYTSTFQSPETVLVLRSVSHFESLYMSRSLNRLNESVGQAVSGGVRVPPGSAEGLAIARTVTNELDSAKFDPLLVRSVAKNVNVALEGFLSRIDNIVGFVFIYLGTIFNLNYSCTRLLGNGMRRQCLDQ